MVRGQAGRYELIRKLGTGSIGEVYEAYDRERQINVALKQLRVLSPMGLRNLRREFWVLQGASHPNIIELHDLVLDETPPFITMELLQGQDLITYVRPKGHSRDATRASLLPEGLSEGAPPTFTDLVHEGRLRKALAQIATGLHAIHEVGIVHRDLKPSNILVTDEGRTVILDFSIAADTRAHVDENRSDDVLIGTPDYMAPEQVTEAAPIPANDWYALGVVMYQALTNKLPFQGTWSQIVEYKQAYDAPPVRQHAVGIPEDLALLCTVLLSRHPHERPSGREILFQLGASDTGDVFANTRRLERIPFMGRSEELALLQKLSTRALGGTGSCVLVTGPSGIGKTRLVQELIERQEEVAGGSLMLLQGRCHPVDQRPHNALDDILDQLSRTLAKLPKQRLRELLPPGHELLPRMFPSCSRIPGIERMPRVRESNLDALRTRTIDVLCALLERMAAANGLLLFIDNAQWADRDSVDLLCDMFQSVPPRRVFLIIALRVAKEYDRSADDTLSGQSPARAEQHARAQEELMTLTGRPDGLLNLGEFKPATRKEFLAWLYRDMPPSLDELGSGVPRLLIERARRALAVPAGDTHLREAVPPIEEDSLERLMTHHMRALSKRERTLIEICALLGYPAPLSLLARIVDLSAAERGSSMDVLRARGLVTRVRAGREPWLAISHDAVRTAVLARLRMERRHELYQRLAEAVQRSGNASNAELAASWYAARDFERAFPYLEVSAKSTRDRFAFHRSAAVYQAALEAVSVASGSGSKDQERDQRLNLARADMLERAGRHRESAFLLERIEDTDLSSIDIGVRASDHRLRGGELGRGRTRLLERITALEERTGGQLVAAPGKGLGNLMRRMRVSWARRRYRPHHEDEVAIRHLHHTDSLSSAAVSLALIDPGASREVHTTALLRVLGHGERGRVARAQASELIYGLMNREIEPDQVSQLGTELAHEARELGEPEGQALSELAIGLASFWRGRIVTADARFTEAREILTWKLPDAHWPLLVTDFMTSLARIARGDLSSYGRFIARALERARRDGDIVSRCLFGSVPDMWCKMATDRVGQGLAMLDELESALAPESGAPLRSVLAMARAMGCLYAGRLDDARQAIDQLVTSAHGMDSGLFAVDIMVLRSRLAVRQSDRPQIADLARSLERHGDDLAVGHGAALRAILAQEAQDTSQAIASLREAASRFATVGARLYEIAVRYRLSGALVDQPEGVEHGRLAQDWSRTQGIANKPRMFDYLCPWSAKESVPNAG